MDSDINADNEKQLQAGETDDTRRLHIFTRDTRSCDRTECEEAKQEKLEVVKDEPDDVCFCYVIYYMFVSS